MLRSVMFNQAMHFEGLHDTEYLYRIGPVDSAAGSTSTEKGETP
jgi:hypothetical protein